MTSHDRLFHPGDPLPMIAMELSGSNGGMRLQAAPARLTLIGTIGNRQIQKIRAL
jgi:hypothetical protein